MEPTTFFGPDIITLSNTIKTGDFEDKYAEDVCVCASTGKKLTLCYNEFGNPSNPLVMLIPGLNCQGLLYDTSVCKWLANQNYYVVRFDNRDSGLSTKFDDVPQNCSPYKLFLPKALAFGEKIPYSLNDMAEDAIALMKYLGHPKAHWVGTSMGGMIVQLVEISHPEACLSATLIMTMSGNNRIAPPSFRTQLGLLFDSPKSKDPEEQMRHRLWFIQTYLAGKWLLDTTLPLKSVREMANRSTWIPDAPRQLCAIVRSPSRDGLLKKVKVPTLIVHGKLDKLIPINNAYHLAQLLPNCQIATYEEMGHYIDPDNIQNVYSGIVNFFKSVENDMEKSKE